MFLDSADALYAKAKERVLGEGRGGGGGGVGGKGKGGGAEAGSGLHLEECPKWSALIEVLEEIQVTSEIQVKHL